MNKTQVMSLRLPLELKSRLERQAKDQGVSINQLASYLLNIEVTRLEMFSGLESRLGKKSIPELKQKVNKILDNISAREVPEWDTL